MKNFSEFKQFLTEREIEKSVHQNLIDSIKKFDYDKVSLKEITEIVTVSNYTTMINLLSLYHEWLNEK